MPEFFPVNMEIATSMYLLGAVLLVLYLANTIRVALRPGLRNLPGPFSARFSRWYRSSLVFGGKAPEEYRKLHEQYGPIVRIGPNHVSFADPVAIPIIYGIGTGNRFLKVSLSLNTVRRKRG